MGLLTGVLTVFFDVAYQAYLPVLVSREHLIEGNSKLEVTNSVARIAGPGVGGALVQFLQRAGSRSPWTPSFVVLSRLPWRSSARSNQSPSATRKQAIQARIWAELREGLGVVLGNPLLRSIAGCTATSNLFGNALQAVYVLYVTRELGIGPALLGLIFSVGGPGALLGSLLAGRVANRFGLGATIIGCSSWATRPT